MAITPRKFVYNTPVVSQIAYENHLKLYNGYVNKLNEIDNILINNPQREKVNSTYSHYRGLKTGETYALDAIILHELYFENMSNTMTSPDARLSDMFRNTFGSLNEWKADFTASAKAARGWAYLIYEQRTNTFRNIVLDAHNEGDISLAYPLIVIDMYEHSYFMDYGTDKESYIEKFIEYIDWDVVAQRYVQLQM